MVPLGLWALRLLRFSLAPTLRAFLLLWTLPTLIFYALTHIGQYGYLLVVLPPLLILSALCIRVLGERISPARVSSGSALGLAICLAVALSSVAYFLLARGPVTAGGIWAQEAHWRSLRGTLGQMDPGSTIFVMQVKWESPFRLAGYLLPQYHSYAIGGAEAGDEGPKGWLYSAFEGRSTYSLPRPQPEPTLTLPPNTRRVVALDEETAEMMRGANLLTHVSLADGTTLYILGASQAEMGKLVVEEGKIRVNGER